MDYDQRKQSVCREHVESECRRYRYLEEGCQSTVSRYRNDCHTHGNIAKMASEGYCCQSLISLGNASFYASAGEVVPQSDPPYPNDDAIERDNPEEDEQATECQLLPQYRKLSFKERSAKDLSQRRMERSYCQHRNGYCKPEIPNDNMKPRLEREKPFSACAGEAVVIRTKGQTDGEGEGEKEASCQRPKACSRSNSCHCRT